jgi:hypothetical protein
MPHRSSPPKVRSADTRRNSRNLPGPPQTRNMRTGAIWGPPRRHLDDGLAAGPLTGRGPPPTCGLHLGAGPRSGQAGQAQVRGAEITDSVVTVRSGGPVQHFGSHVGDTPA